MRESLGCNGALVIPWVFSDSLQSGFPFWDDIPLSQSTYSG